MIIDAHAHIYPDKIAEKAAAGISAFYDGMKIDSNGTVGELLLKGDEAGVDRFIVQSVATVPEQVTAINNFIAESVRRFPERLTGFGALHPDFPDVAGETERIISLGLRGVKLHSDFQQFDMDDERAFPIYEACEGRLPILFHMGYNKQDRTSPEKLLKILKKFPRLTVIGAHFAGEAEWESGAELFSYDFYTDCSSTLNLTSPEQAADIIRKIGAQRVMWGTDYPIWNAKRELEKFSRLPLTDGEREQVLYKTALRLLGESVTSA